MVKGLTEKQRRFVEAYTGVANGVATQAARLAGYSGDDRALSVIGTRTLRITRVADAVEAIRERSRTKPSIMTREQRQDLLSKFAKDESLSKKDRMRAIEILGKMQGDFIERLELSGSVETQVMVYLPSNGRDGA